MYWASFTTVQARRSVMMPNVLSLAPVTFPTGVLRAASAPCLRRNVAGLTAIYRLFSQYEWTISCLQI